MSYSDDMKDYQAEIEIRESRKLNFFMPKEVQYANCEKMETPANDKISNELILDVKLHEQLEKQRSRETK